MFDALFPSHWSDIQKLMWLKILNGGSAVWDTITGNPVSFSAKAAPLRQLKVAFSPKQDLHGYDSPWPAGGGKNKFDPSAATVGINWNGSAMAYSIASDYIPVEVGKGYTISVADMPKYTGVTVAFLDANKNYVTNGSSTSFDVTDGIVFIRISFRCANTDAWTETDLANAKIQVEQSATATAWTPYSNICPISGWSSLTVEQRGKNLVDQSAMTHTGVVNDSGDVSTNNTHLWTPLSPVMPSSKLWVTVDGESSLQETISVNRLIFFDKSQQFIGRTNISGTSPKVSGGADVPNNAYYFSVDLRTSALTTEINVFDVSELMVSYGQAATAYTPYNPLSRSISISLGSTVYSGTVDVVTGVVTVDMAEVDMGDVIWTAATSGGVRIFYAELSGKGGKIATAFNAMCSCYKRKDNVPYVDGCFIAYGSTSMNFSRIAVRDDACAEMTATEYMNHIRGQTIVFELQTPIPIQLTPQEINSLAGDNVLFSDTNGDLTVEYRSN